MSHATIAVVTSDPGGPVVRHRFLAYERALADRGIALDVVTWAKDPESRREALRRIEATDATVVSSRLLTRRDVRRVRDLARRLAFDFDDALPYRDSRRGAGRSRVRTSRFNAIVRAADRVTAGNTYLADLALRGGRAATVIPTTVVAPRVRTPETASDEGLVVGWIGSRATSPYLEAVHARWQRAPFERPVTLRVIADVAPDLPDVPVDFVPWQADSWEAALRGIHFGIAPLPDDPWTRGKCGLKVLQMLALGRPVLADPVGVQQEQIQDEVTGFLPTSPAAFSDCLARLARDDALRERMGTAAFDDVRARWSTRAWSAAVCDEYEALLA